MNDRHIAAPYEVHDYGFMSEEEWDRLEARLEEKRRRLALVLTLARDAATILLDIERNRYLHPFANVEGQYLALGKALRSALAEHETA
jgi:hypothetical protein